MNTRTVEHRGYCLDCGKEVTAYRTKLHGFFKDRHGHCVMNGTTADFYVRHGMVAPKGKAGAAA